MAKETSGQWLQRHRGRQFPVTNETSTSIKGRGEEALMGEWRFGICLDKSGAAWSEYSAPHDSPSVCCDADPASSKSLANVRL